MGQKARLLYQIKEANALLDAPPLPLTISRMFPNWQLEDLIDLVRVRYPGWDGFEHAQFVDDEVRRKRRTIGRAAELLSQEEVQRLVSGWHYEELLARLERLGRDNNLLFNRVPRQGDLAILFHARPNVGEFALQMQLLLYGQQATAQRVQAFSTYALQNSLPNKWTFPTYFLFITHPDAELFVRPQVARWFLKYVGHGKQYNPTPSGQVYGLLRGYAHALLEALRPLGAQDMVHMQSFLWICARESRRRTGRLDARGQVELDVPPTIYGAGAQPAFLHETADQDEAYAPETAAEQPVGNTAGDPGDEPPGGQRVAPYTLAALAADTGFDEEELARWAQAVERKGQAVFYGPPGTGKTLLARGLARHLAGGGDGFYELVQFHPAYQYEDFIQGLRPVTREGGDLGYEMAPGRFLTFCREAERRSGICVLIVDEINRANLSRVFGELLFLLEYRDQAIPLAGGGQLSIPQNVRLIGTMNTADRSIALMDHALRRRFAFIALRPDYDVLRRYHQRHATGFPMQRLIGVLERLNRQIGDARYEVGITYFLRPDLAEKLGDVWQMEIEPYLEEYFFDRPEEVEAFRWERVRGSVKV